MLTNNSMSHFEAAEKMKNQFAQDAHNARSLKTNMRELEKRMNSIPPEQLPETDALYHQAARALDDIRERAITSAVGLASVLPHAEESKRIATRLGYDSVEAFLENNKGTIYSEELQTVIDANPNSMERMFEQQQELPQENAISK